MTYMDSFVNQIQDDLKHDQKNEKKAEKNTEKKGKKNALKAEKTAFTGQSSDSNISEEKNEQKNEEKTFENVEKNSENDSENEFPDFEDDSDLFDGDDLDDDGDLDDLDDDSDLSDLDDDLGDSESDDSDDEIEEGEDPMSDFKKDPNTPEPEIPIEDVIPPPSPKTGKMIDKLGKAALFKLDEMKAKACSKISGQHVAEYLSDAEMMDLLYEAIKEYLKSMEAKPLTPFGQLVTALLLWSVPAFGSALWHKYSMPAPQITNENTAPSEEKTSTNSTMAVDYSRLKEFQDGRKVFTVNKERGFYNTSVLGTYIKAELSNEAPSPIIAKWLEEGMSSKEIRAKLYGKK